MPAGVGGGNIAAARDRAPGHAQNPRLAAAVVLQQDVRAAVTSEIRGGLDMPAGLGRSDIVERGRHILDYPDLTGSVILIHDVRLARADELACGYHVPTGIGGAVAPPTNNGIAVHLP